MEIIQSQMRANRDEVATQIIQKMGQPTSTYPLSLAYTDLETYYRAGTFASGVLKAAEVVGSNAAEAQDAKDKARFITSTLATDNTMTVLRNFIRPNGKYDKARIAQLNALMAKDPAFLGANGNPWLATQLITPETAGLRALLIQKARAQGIKM